MFQSTKSFFKKYNKKKPRNPRLSFIIALSYLSIYETSYSAYFGSVHANDDCTLAAELISDPRYNSICNRFRFIVINKYVASNNSTLNFNPKILFFQNIFSILIYYRFARVIRSKCQCP